MLGVVHAMAGAQATTPEPLPLAACIDGLRRELPQNPSVRTETFDAQTRVAQDLRPVIRAATESQPEFRLAVWDYIARLVDSERIADGKVVLMAQADRKSVV